MMSDAPPSVLPIDAAKQESSRGLVAVIARNASFVLGAQVVLKVLALLFNVYVVRQLGAVHFGQYSAVMAYVAIFGIFTDFGMAPYAVREMAEDHRRTSWLLPSVVVIRMLLSLPVICLAPLSAYWLGKGPDMVLGILIASIGQLVYAVQGPLDNALTARERLEYVAAFSLVNQLAFWGLGVFLLVSGVGFISLIVASLVGVGITALLSGWVLFRKLGTGRLVLSVDRWPQLLSSAFPFAVSGIADVFARRFDTALMSIVLTDADVGWYNAPYALLMMMLLLAQSIAIAMYPSMVRGHKADPGSLGEVTQRTVRYLLLISLPIAVGGTILADKIILLLYTEEFARSIPVLQIVLWTLPSLFVLEILGRAANVLHLERAAAKINLANAAVTVLLNLLLVPTLGMVGGALALLVGRTVRLIQLWTLIGSKKIVRQQWQPLLKVLLAAVLMGLAVFSLRWLPLILSIGIGAVLYVLLVLGLRAMSAGELRYLVQALIRQKDVRNVT